MTRPERTEHGRAGLHLRRSLALGMGMLATAALVAGCQSPPRKEVERGRLGSEGQCIRMASVGSYRVLDERTILVDVGAQQKLIEVYSDCDSLRFAEDIGLEGRAGQLCDYRADKLLVNGRACTIASIRDYDIDPDIIQLPRLELNEEDVFDLDR